MLRSSWFYRARTDSTSVGYRDDVGGNPLEFGRRETTTWPRRGRVDGAVPYGRMAIMRESFDEKIDKMKNHSPYFIAFDVK